MLASIRFWIGSVTKKIYERRKILIKLGCFVFLVSLVALVWAKPAQAEIDLIGSIKEGSSWVLLQVANLFLRVSLFFLSLILQISAYNGYLDATAVNVGWVMVRDMTNMFFIAILMLIAFGTILGIEQYEWKKLLVKFVLAAIFVNFSRTICGVFIDLSQLVMTTFVNGIASTAGGNLINMFNLDKITKISNSANPETLAPGIFVASLAALVFSATVMYTLGIFVFILVARLIRLWVLIVLSPIAFVLGVLPMTQSQAGQWWSEFWDDIVTGPVLLFFIWLSFVTVGTGQINTEIANDPSVPEELKIRDDAVLDSEKLQGQTTGIGDAMGWNKMAGFAIAIGMLLAGARVASSIGGSSGSALTGVAGFAKKVGTIASGYVAGRWLYEGAAKPAAGLIGKGIKEVAARTRILPMIKKGDDGKWKVGRVGARTFGKMVKNKVVEQWGALTNTVLEGTGPRARREGQTAVRLDNGEVENVNDEKLAEMKKNGVNFTVVKEKRMVEKHKKIFVTEWEEVEVEKDGKKVKEKVLNKGNEELQNARGEFLDEHGNVVAHERFVDTNDNNRVKYLDDKKNVVAIANGVGADGKTKFVDENGQEVKNKIFIPDFKQKKVMDEWEEEVPDFNTSTKGYNMQQVGNEWVPKTKKVKHTKARAVGKEVQGEVELESAEELRDRTTFGGGMREAMAGKTGVGKILGLGRGLLLGAGRSWVGGGAKELSWLMASDKAVKKTEDHKKQLEERLSSQTSGFPKPFFLTKLFGNADWIDGEDRMVQGMNKAEKARSAAKTEEFQSMGEGAALAAKRFKSGVYQNEKGTMAEQIADHKGRAAAAMASIQQLTEEAKKRFAKDQKSQKYLQAKIFAELKMKTAQAQTKAQEAKVLTQMQKVPEGLAEIYKAIEAEKEAHLDEERQKAIKTDQTRKYNESKPGRAELAEAATLKAQMEKDEAKVKVDEGWFRRLMMGLEQPRDAAEQKMLAGLKNKGVSVEQGVRDLAERVKWEERSKRGQSVMSKGEEEERAKFSATVEGKKWLDEKKAADARVATAKTKTEAEESEAAARFITGEAEAETTAGMTQTQIDDAKRNAALKAALVYRERQAAMMRKQAGEGTVKLRETQEKEQAMKQGAGKAAFEEIQATGLQQTRSDKLIKEMEAKGKVEASQKAEGIAAMAGSAAADWATKALEDEFKEAEGQMKRYVVGGDKEAKELAEKIAANVPAWQQPEVEQEIAKQLAKGRQADVEVARMGQKLKRGESRQKELDEKTKEEVLSETDVRQWLADQKEAEVRTGKHTAAIKKAEEAAKTEAQTTEEGSLKEAKVLELETTEQTAKQKLQEEKAKKWAIRDDSSGRGQAADFQAKLAKVQMAAETGEIKEVQEESKRMATEAEKDAAVLRAKRAEVRTGRETADIGAIEAQAKAQAAEQLRDVIARTNVSEQTKKAADDLLKAIKDDVLRQQANASMTTLRTGLEGIKFGREADVKVVDDNLKAEINRIKADGSLDDVAKQRAIQAAQTSAASQLSTIRTRYTQEENQLFSRDAFGNAIYYGRIATVRANQAKANLGLVTEQFSLTHLAEDLATEAADTSLYEKIGDEALKALDDKKLEAETSQRLAALQKIPRLDAVENYGLANRDPAIRGLINRIRAGKQAKIGKTALDQLDSAVGSRFVNMEDRNFDTPGLELLELIKSMGQSVQPLDESGRGSAMARVSAMFSRLRKAGQAPNKTQLLEGAAVAVNNVGQGNVDDGHSSVAGLINVLERYTKLKAVANDTTKSDAVRNEARNAIKGLIPPDLSEADFERRELPDMQAIREDAMRFGWVHQTMDKDEGKKLQEVITKKLQEARATNGEDLSQDEVTKIMTQTEAEYESELAKTGKSLRRWTDQSDFKHTRSYMMHNLTGGDTGYVESMEKVLNFMEVNKIGNFNEAVTRYFTEQKDIDLTSEKAAKTKQLIAAESKRLGRKLTRDEAMKKYQEVSSSIDERRTNEQAPETAEAFAARQAQHQELLNSVQEHVKETAFKAGHTQLVIMGKDDKTGNARPFTESEHIALVGGTTVKTDNMKAQPQGHARYSNDGGYIEAMDEMKLGLMKQFSLNTVIEISNRTDDREKRTTVGLHKLDKGHTEDGFMALSSDIDHIRKMGEGDVLTGLFAQSVNIHGKQAVYTQNMPQWLEAVFKTGNKEGAENGAIMKVTMAGFKEYFKKHPEEFAGLGLSENDFDAYSLGQFSDKLADFIGKSEAIVQKRMAAKIEAAKQRGDHEMAADLQAKWNEMKATLDSGLVKKLKDVAVEANKKTNEFLQRKKIRSGDPRDYFSAASESGPDTTDQDQQATEPPEPPFGGGGTS